MQQQRAEGGEETIGADDPVSRPHSRMHSPIVTHFIIIVACCIVALLHAAVKEEL